jgi:hypothetical protein
MRFVAAKAWTPQIVCYLEQNACSLARCVGGGGGGGRPPPAGRLRRPAALPRTPLQPVVPPKATLHQQPPLPSTASVSAFTHAPEDDTGNVRAARSIVYDVGIAVFSADGPRSSSSSAAAAVWAADISARHGQYALHFWDKNFRRSVYGCMFACLLCSGRFLRDMAMVRSRCSMREWVLGAARIAGAWRRSPRLAA